jgi:hypothetical protein
MRTILLGLLLLAGMKVWFLDHTYRTAMADAVVEAYRERAVEVCRRSASKRPAGSRDDGTSAWGLDTSAEVVIGDPDLSVAIWDTQNPLWNQRFRNPHLILTSGTGGSRRCAYDVRQGGATLSAAAR